jgi:hypothetical protein
VKGARGEKRPADVSGAAVMIAKIRHGRYWPVLLSILPYEPGYTGHWEIEKRRKETREWLREREQQVMRDRINAPSIVPQTGPAATSPA